MEQIAREALRYLGASGADEALHHQALEAAQLAAAGVRLLMVDGTLLSDAELAHEVVRLKAALAAAKAGEAAPRRERGATSGHLRHGIE